MAKFFRVAASGKTIDGREITPEMLTQAAETYDREVYGARINLEHARGLLPDGPFKSFGDVISLKTEKQDGLTILLAELDPTPELIELNKKRQKIYTSIELTSNFKGEGKHYLSGLAITDSPASTHVEAMKFTIEARKDEDGAGMFSEFTELEGLLEDAAPGTGENIFTKVKKLLSKAGDKTSQQFKHCEAAILELTNEVRRANEENAELKATVDELSKKSNQVDELSTNFADLKASLEEEAGGYQRPEHKGPRRDQNRLLKATQTFP